MKDDELKQNYSFVSFLTDVSISIADFSSKSNLSLSNQIDLLSLQSKINNIILKITFNV